MWLPFRVLPCLLLTACTAYLAATSEPRRDLSVLEAGTPRVRVVAELGHPLRTETKEDGQISDQFRFIQGRSTASDTVRSLIYAGAFVASSSASELLLTPIEERIRDRAVIALTVHYSADERVCKLVLHGEETQRIVREALDEPDGTVAAPAGATPDDLADPCGMP